MGKRARDADAGNGTLKKKNYEERLEPLQLELNNIMHWLRHSGRRMAVIFEGRDAAGKGGTINAITRQMNPRQFRVVALGTPTERERSQWYFQRYLAHLPAAGELVLFDRSWYNRAGVEKVMGFCTEREYRRFLEDCPVVEKLLTDDGLFLLKYWLAVDQEFQEERFAERADDPLKRWKLSPVDLRAREYYEDYGRARDAMIKATHKPHAPWFIVNYNDQRQGRLDLISHLVKQVPDYRVPKQAVKLPRLKGRLKRETFRGPVRPIPSDG